MTEELRKLINENLLVGEEIENCYASSGHEATHWDIKHKTYNVGFGLLTHAKTTEKSEYHYEGVYGENSKPIDFSKYHFKDFDEAIEFSLAYLNHLKKVEKTSKNEIEKIKALVNEKKAFETFLRSRKTETTDCSSNLSLALKFRKTDIDLSSSFIPPSNVSSPPCYPIYDGERKVLYNLPRFDISKHMSEEEQSSLVIELKPETDKIIEEKRKAEEEKRKAEERRERERKEEIARIKKEKELAAEQERKKQEEKKRKAREKQEKRLAIKEKVKYSFLSLAPVKKILDIHEKRKAERNLKKLNDGLDLK